MVHYCKQCSTEQLVIKKCLRFCWEMSLFSFSSHLHQNSLSSYTYKFYTSLMKFSPDCSKTQSFRVTKSFGFGIRHKCVGESQISYLLPILLEPWYLKPQIVWGLENESHEKHLVQCPTQNSLHQRGWHCQCHAYYNLITPSWSSSVEQRTAILLWNRNQPLSQYYQRITYNQMSPHDNILC